MRAKHQVKLYVGPYQDFYHASRIYAGLCELAARGEIDLEFAIPPRNRWFLAKYPYIICLEVRPQDALKSHLIAIDLSDHSTSLISEVLAECDVYMKRSFYRPDMRSLPDHFGTKVVPWGLNYAARTTASTSKLFRTLIPSYISHFLRSPADALNQIKRQASVMYRYWVTPPPELFEVLPTQRLEPVIVLQSRVWTAEDVLEPVRLVNEERVLLIRELRKAFGSRFLGGLVSTEYAKRHYPDLVSELPSRPERFVAWSKRALIGICSRGLHHSLAFKLAEYLAGSKCILSTELRNELPVPLCNGQHYLGFTNVGECVELCAKLLSSPHLVSDLRQQAWDYYLAELQPATHMRNSIDRAVSLSHGVANGGNTG